MREEGIRMYADTLRHLGEQLQKDYPFEKDVLSGAVIYPHYLLGAGVENIESDARFKEAPIVLVYTADVERERVLFRFFVSPFRFALFIKKAFPLGVPDVVYSLSLDAFKQIVEAYAGGRADPDFFLMSVPDDFEIDVEVYVLNDGKYKPARFNKVYVRKDYFGGRNSGVEEVGRFILREYVLPLLISSAV